MKKVLSIVWRIIKWYAMFNTGVWAFIGVGRYFSECSKVHYLFWNPHQEVRDEIEEAFDGYKDLIREIKELF